MRVNADLLARTFHRLEVPARQVLDLFRVQRPEAVHQVDGLGLGLG